MQHSEPSKPSKEKLLPARIEAKAVCLCHEGKEIFEITADCVVIARMHHNRRQTVTLAAGLLLHLSAPGGPLSPITPEVNSVVQALSEWLEIPF